MLQTLSNVRGLKDPLKQYMVEFEITEFPIINFITMAGKVINAIGNVGKPNPVADIKDLKFRALSFSYPTPKIKQTETVINGFSRKIGSIQDKSGTWKCRITENYDGSIIQLLQNWCDCIHNTELGFRLPSIAYTTTCQVIIYNIKGKKSRRIYLRGFYPIEYTVGEINPSSSDSVEIDVTFNYDFYSGTEHLF